jgi:hypothetical protein
MMMPLSYEERLAVLKASTGLSEVELRQQEYEILVSSSSLSHPTLQP